jgi:arginase
MKKRHLNILIPQWQGGGQNLSTYQGAMELKNNYLNGLRLEEVEVSTGNVSEMKNNIIGYDEIFKQLEDAKLQITKNQPETIFTIGGGCDAEIASISHLNDITKSDLTMVYFDARGDIIYQINYQV